MKALKQNIWKPVCFVLILVMAVVVMWFTTNGHRSYVRDSEALGSKMDRWIGQINTKGTDSFIQDDMAEVTSHLPEGGNLVILDGSGKVLSKTSEDFIGKQTTLNLMLSPYISGREDWVSSDGRYEDYAETRLALLTDALGNITGTLRCVSSVDASAVGQDLPKYSEYFPTLNKDYYQDARDFMNDGWSDYDWSKVQSSDPETAAMDNTLAGSGTSTSPLPSVSNSSAYDTLEMVEYGDYRQTLPDTTMAQKVKTYTLWENAQMARAGNMRMVYRGPAWDGTQLLVIYPDSDSMHQSLIAFHAHMDTANRMAAVLVCLIALFIVSLAAWVYVDAKRRDYRPALWGILTLIGNVVAWLVYMLVRPNGRAAKGCPGCGAAVRGSYAYCANCGAQLCETCQRCGKVVEPSFHYCPNCGKQVGGEALPTPVE